MRNSTEQPRPAWQGFFGLDTDERMVEVQDLASKRAYLALAFGMALLGGYHFLVRGRTGAALGLVAVAVSTLYLAWVRHQLSDGGPLDERAQRIFTDRFHYASVGLYLVCLLMPLAGESYLWSMLFVLPMVTVIGTLFLRRVNSWRVWTLWLGITFLLGIASGVVLVLRPSTPQYGWILVVFLGLVSGGIGIATYRRHRSM
jgi:hypothetical protein